MKQPFVTAFQKFLQEKVSYYSDIQRLIYVELPYGEYIYIIYSGDRQKRVDITADSEKAIISDFLKQEPDAAWLTDERRINVEDYN